MKWRELVREKRIAFVEMTPELVVGMLRGSSKRRYKTNLPDDAEFVAMYYDDWKRIMRVHLASKTFQPVPEGAELPRFEVIAEYVE